MYRIVDWDKYFENNRTRELKKLTWVPIPNKQDGDGYTELMDHPDGVVHYGVWCAIVGVASKCDPRGTLVRDGARPHNEASLSRMTRIPAAVIRAAMTRLVETIGWVEIIPDPPTSNGVATISHERAALEPHRHAARSQDSALKGIEEKGIEEKGTEFSLANEPVTAKVDGREYAAGASNGKPPKQPRPYTADFERWWEIYPRKVKKETAFPEFEKAVKRIGIQRQLLPIEALDWLMKVTRIYAECREGKDPTKTPHPPTWLHGGRYDDDQATWRQPDISDNPRAAASDLRRELDRRDQDYVAPQ